MSTSGQGIGYTGEDRIEEYISAHIQPESSLPIIYYYGPSKEEEEEEESENTQFYEEESKGWWLAACDAKEERERLKEQIPKWIPVTERLPEKIGYYLTHIANINQMSMATDVVALWDGNHFYVSSFVAVTHWMPLPQPPESEGKLWES